MIMNNATDGKAESAVRNIESILPHLQAAKRMVEREIAKAGLSASVIGAKAILAIGFEQLDGGGRILCKLDLADFLDDLETLLASVLPPPTHMDLYSIYELCASGKSQEAIDVVFDHGYGIGTKREIDAFNYSLEKLDTARCDEAVLVSILTVSAPIADRLPARARVLAEAKTICAKTETPEGMAELFRGLEGTPEQTESARTANDELMRMITGSKKASG